jgi:hypothetical protein
MAAPAQGKFLGVLVSITLLPANGIAAVVRDDHLFGERHVS